MGFQLNLYRQFASQAPPHLFPPGFLRFNWVRNVLGYQSHAEGVPWKCQEHPQLILTTRHWIRSFGWLNIQYFKLEVSLVLPSLVAPLSRQDDGIVGQTNILSNPPFHGDHGNAILWHWVLLRLDVASLNQIVCQCTFWLVATCYQLPH